MKHSEVKNRIITTASSLFYKQGYNSTGINEIISESGIAKATLYNHFKSKQEICLAYLQHKNNVFIEDIKEFIITKSNGKSQVLGIFDFLEFFFNSEGFNGCWCLKTVAEIPYDDEIIRNEIKEQKKGLIAFIAQLITANLQGIEQEDVLHISRRIYLLYEGAVSESHLHQEVWPIKEAKLVCSKIIA